MSEHTPGPWEWVGSPHDDEEVGDAATFENDVASCALVSESGKIVLLPWDAESYSAGVDIRKTDAQLIAAAPDLLLACQMAEDIISKAITPHRPQTVTMAVYAKIKDAIAKATGK